MNPLKKPNSFEEKLKKQLEASEWKPSDALWDRIEQNMQANSFEPKLQEKLSDFTVNPSEDFWEKLEPQLPESRKRRGIFWFSVVLLAAVSSFGIGYWFKVNTTQNSDTLVLNNQTITTKENITNTGLPKSTVGALSEPKSKQNIVGQGEKEEAISSTENNSTQKAVLELPNPVSSNEALLQKNNSAVTENTSKVQNNLVQTNKKKQKRKLASSKKDVGVLEVLNDIGKHPPSSSEEPSLGFKQIQSKNIPPSLVNDSSREMKVPGAMAIEILGSKNINAAAKDSFAENKPVRGNMYMEPEVSFTSFSVTALAGMHYGMMAISKPESNVYNLEKAYNLRTSMEKPNLDFAGALWLDYHINQSWMISTGVGITSFSQTLKFNVVDANQAPYPKIQPENRYMHSSDSIISGNSNTYENRYSFTEIPLQISYHFRSDNSFQFSLGAGISYARLNVVNVLMPDPSCIGLLNITDKNAFPKFKDVFFASFNPSLSYKINSGVSLGLMPSFKMSLQNMVDNKDWIAQRPNMVGLNIFLRKKF